MDRLLGSYRFAVDAKGRINIPARFRKVLSPEPDGPMIVTRGLERCLAVYPLAQWEIEERKLRSLPYTKSHARFYAREMASQAMDTALDKQGRILLSREHREWANIGDEVLILGVITHLEIFSPEVHEAYRSGFGMSYEQVAEEIFRPDFGESRE